MESAGQVLRNKEGRWAIVPTKTNGHAATASNGNPLDAPQRAPQGFTGPSVLEEIFPISLRGEGDIEGAFPVSPKFLGCSPPMRAWRVLWRIVLRLGSPENRGKTRLLRCGGYEGK
jgi:hypothetical protein